MDNFFSFKKKVKQNLSGVHQIIENNIDINDIITKLGKINNKIVANGINNVKFEFVELESKLGNSKGIKIFLCIDGNKYIDVLVITKYDISENIEIIYDWKNNFSDIFLSKIFSLSEKAYVILRFYYLLLEYNKKIINSKKIDVYEYIDYIINGTNIVIPDVNYNTTNYQLFRILEEEIDSNSRFIKSLDNDNLEYNIESYYSYDYFIDTYFISSLYIKNKVNKNKNKYNLNNVNQEKLKKNISTNFERSDYYINNKMLPKNSFFNNYIKNINKIYEKKFKKKKYRKFILQKNLIPIISSYF